MGIRIQPKEIEIPKDNPFQHDLLGRRQSIEVFSHLLSDIEGPCVLSLDGDWGAGKTTFLGMWSQYLKNQQFIVVEFNAWATDFSEDPFVALSTEITNQLSAYGDESFRQKVVLAKNAATKVLVRAIPAAIKVGTAGLLDLSPLIGTALSEAMASYTEERVVRYTEAQNSIEGFRKSLEEMAVSLTTSTGSKPLVVIIDELDRCRPTYAIELLEVTKHLFAVDNIIFVLATNKTALAHSVKALYGYEFDAEGYLRRFFDLDLRLPEPQRDSFTRAMINAIQLDTYFNRTLDRSVSTEKGTIDSILVHIFHMSNLSLRSIAQALHRFGLVYASLGNRSRALIAMATVALIIRTIDLSLYYRFIRNEVSDEDVINQINAKLIPSDTKHANVVFESLVIEAARNNHSYEGKDYSSPLLRYYQGLVEKANGQPMTPDIEYARSVIQMVQYHTMNFNHQSEFKYAVERIELISSSLISPLTSEDSSS